MRDAARSGRKRWELGNWDLRWKVTAVLAVPLAVAVGLGVGKVSSEWGNATQLSAEAANVETIPVISALNTTTLTVAGEQAIDLGGRSLVTQEHLDALAEVIPQAEGAASELAEIPQAQESLQTMIGAAKTVHAQGEAPSKLDPEAARESMDEFRRNGVRAVETIAARVDDRQVDAAKLRLVDSLNARAQMLGEVVALAEFPADASAAIQLYKVAVHTERVMLGLLAQRLPADDPDVAELYQGIAEREQLFTGIQAQAGVPDLTGAQESLTSDLALYQEILTTATQEVITEVRGLADDARGDAMLYSIVMLLTIMAALVLAVVVARSMIVPLHRLRLAALKVAENDLPQEVAELRAGATPEEVPLEPMPIRSEEEIGQLARAVDDIHGQALRLASDQAQMRAQVNDMFETLARRSKSLVDHQLSLIEAMEYDEKDPRLLENLFRLDHLAARMRRNGDNLLILAGTKQRRAKSAPVEIADVLRAAISEVEDYERVKLGATPRGSLLEPAASDLAHLFAELLDNALRASPPETDVRFTFAPVGDQGLLIEVADRGIGIPPGEMADINRRLATTAEPSPDTARHMGLFVVGRLAERHGLTVRLRATFDSARDPGVTVSVQVPSKLIVADKTAVLAKVPGADPQPAAAPQPPSPSSMQMRSVSRTPSGNTMVTVDPGMSGPIPMTTGERPATSPGTPGGGLPQRQPGTAMAAGLQGANEQAGATLRPTPGVKPAANTPQRGKLAAANLPKRNLPGSTPGGGLGPMDSRPANPSGDRAPGSAPTGLPSGGLPQRQPGGDAGAAPQQPAPTPHGLPQRQPGAHGAPGGSGAGQRGPAGAGHGAAAGGLPQRKPASAGGATGPSGLPQRKPAGQAESSPVPERPDTQPAFRAQPPRPDSFGPSGLPQRKPGGPAEPARAAERPDSQNQPSARRQPPPADGSGPSGLPQRSPGANGLPQRTPNPQRTEPSAPLPADAVGQATETGNGATSPEAPRRPGTLPQRRPGANSASEIQNAPGVALPRRTPEPEPNTTPPDSAAAVRDSGRHSYRPSPARTASFFQTRLQPASESDPPVGGGTPIFAEMMSAWLSDPSTDQAQSAPNFSSHADDGWQAAQRASEAQAENTTAAGLPQRNPGGRLVPGAVNTASPRSARRDPETIRSSLSRHQQGVRDGRAMRAMNLTGDKGDQ